MAYINIETIELIKYSDDVFAVRINGKLLVSMLDPNEYVEETDDIIQHGLAPQKHAMDMYAAMQAKKMRQDAVLENPPTVIRTHP
jgi:hypothetical protein